MPLIPPELQAKLRQLRLGSRRRPPGQGLGPHASSARGTGLEFSQYRGYEPGDDVRRIDWKLHARSDRLYVRESERDSSLTVWLLLDTTGSMRQTDRARPDRSKLDVARILAACLAEIAARQGDRIGLASFGDGPVCLPPAAGLRHRDRLLLTLDRLRASGGWPGPSAARALWPRLHAEALLIALGDGFDDEVVRFMLQLAQARRELVFMQLLGADECEFPFEGTARLVDPESGAVRTVDAAAVRRDYRAGFAAAQAGLARACQAAGIRHAVHRLDEPLERPLRRLFAARP